MENNVGKPEKGLTMQTFEEFLREKYNDQYVDSLLSQYSPVTSQLIEYAKEWHSQEVKRNVPSVGELLEIMNKFLVHSNDCTGLRSVSIKCNCGFEKTATAIHQQLKEGNG